MLTNYKYAEGQDPQTGQATQPATGFCTCGQQLELTCHYNDCKCGRTYDKSGSEMV